MNKLVAALAVAVLAAACGAPARPPIAAAPALEGDAPPPPAPAPEPGDAVDTQLFALDASGTHVYALELVIEHVSALSVGAPVEAGADRDVHVFVLGSAPYDSASAAACRRLISPLPAGQDPCGPVIIPLARNAVEVGGVLTLSASADVVRGQVDAFVRDDEDARGNFDSSLAP